MQRDVPLAPLTTLRLGGAADFFAEIHHVEELREAIRWARSRVLPFAFLGGGSNTLVPDAGYRGLVIHLKMKGVTLEGAEHRVAAGEDWSAFVQSTVNDGFAGLECLAGIPGSVGATPIQNVGAYGQEVCETITSVSCLDLETLMPIERSAADCRFRYRDSDFKQTPGRYVVTAVGFRLTPNGKPARRYRELAEHSTEETTLKQIHSQVLTLRRRKSMVLASDDANTQSAGSFFTNPILSADRAAQLMARLERDGHADQNPVPHWPMADGRVKFAAGWLLERAGCVRGSRVGNMGQSDKHALALVHHGGGSMNELLAFADQIEAQVRTAFGVSLQREPRLLQW